MSQRQLFRTEKPSAPVRLQVGAAHGRRPLDYEPPGRVTLGRWNGSPEDDFRTFMRLYGHVGAKDFGRRCSETTYTHRKVNIWAAFNVVRSTVRRIDHLSQMTPRHIPVILANWNEPDAFGKPRIKHSTQVQNFSILAWFWRIHGIKIGSIKDYVAPEKRNDFKRSFVATVDKSWSANGVDVDQIIEKARQIDPVVARLLVLGRTFGMRVNETLRLTPHEADQSDRLVLTKGTKGGRPREIEYSEFGEDALKQAIESVKAELEPGQHAAWQGRTLKQARKHVYYVLRQLGVTRNGLGVTFHGLRAQWAIEAFERLTSAKTPIRGGSIIDYRQFNTQRRTIARALGHNRIAVTSAYYGSFFKMKAPAEIKFKKSWDKLSPLLPTLKFVLNDLGIKNCWWVGARAAGSNPTEQEVWEFLLDDQVGTEDALRAKKAIYECLEGHLGSCYVHDSVNASQASLRRWQEAALPLFDVEAPKLTIDENYTPVQTEL